jgi:hypothetical protein
MAREGSLRRRTNRNHHRREGEVRKGKKNNERLC